MALRESLCVFLAFASLTLLNACSSNPHRSSAANHDATMSPIAKTVEAEKAKQAEK